MAALLIAAATWVVGRSPGLSEAVLWRVDGWQPLPTLTQRVFERRLVAHQLGQDRLVPPGAILFFGDSHLHALPMGGLNQAYNFAIGGESAQRLALRLAHYTALPAARAVVIGTGTNDLLEGRTPEQAEDAWQAILRQMPSSAVVVCVEIPLNRDHATHATLHEDLNRRISAACRQHGHAVVSVVPGVDAFTGVSFSADALHLDPAGSRRLLARIESAIKKPE